MVKNKICLIVLSLPVVTAVIAFFIPGAPLAPFSYNAMERTTALVEQTTTYSIVAGGKTVAYFSGIGDSMSLKGMVPADSGKTEIRKTAAGVWVNTMPLVPSCRGHIIVPCGNSATDSMVTTINRNIRTYLEKETNRQRGILRKTKEKAAELDYYLDTHNVQDEGFAIMAMQAGMAKAEKNRTERIIGIIEKAIAEKHVEVRINTVYLAKSTGKDGKTISTPCTKTGNEYTHGFIMLQATDHKTPPCARAVYINPLIRWKPGSGDSIMAAGICGAGTHLFELAEKTTLITGGHAAENQRHDMPRLLVPDGSPVFNKYGMFIGISKDGTIADVKKKNTYNKK